MAKENETNARTCPYCKEEILADAIKCKHCGSSIAAEKPAHKGTCPYCKEQINPEAIKCKHCQSMLGQSDSLAKDTVGCGCGGIDRQTMSGSTGQTNMGGSPIMSFSPAQSQPGFGSGLGLFKVKCKIKCGACRDCFPWVGCVDYPCCELSDCEIVIGK